MQLLEPLSLNLNSLNTDYKQRITNRSPFKSFIYYNNVLPMISGIFWIQRGEGTILEWSLGGSWKEFEMQLESGKKTE